MTTVRSEAGLHHSLADISRLLAKHRVLETMTDKLAGPRRDLLQHMQHQQNLSELRRRLASMHVADVAFVIEALPPEDREIVCGQLSPEQLGVTFVEVSPAVRGSIAAFMPRETLTAALQTLPPDDLRFVAESIPGDVLDAVSLALETGERSVFEDSSRYAEGSVGRHMTRDWIAVPESDTVQEVLRRLRERSDLPPQTDRLFVVDSRNVLRGDVSLPALIVADIDRAVAAVMRSESLSFGAHDDVSEAAKAFERYNLVSAPVVDERGKLLGRLTVDAVMDVLREESELRALKNAGLSGDEDLFAAPWQSARNRWPWLAINLVTAFIASRVIGYFEGTIERLAALAALMPIVASVGGNTGNQTMALVIRGLALDRIREGSASRLLRKELTISVLNGVVWGGVIGLIAMALYANVALGAVMASAVVFNLAVAAVAGVLIPLLLHATGRDPARGSSVLLTFTTDATGFLLFLGLASAFLS